MEIDGNALIKKLETKKNSINKKNKVKLEA